MGLNFRHGSLLARRRDGGGRLLFLGGTENLLDHALDAFRDGRDRMFVSIVLRAARAGRLVVHGSSLSLDKLAHAPLRHAPIGVLFHDVIAGLLGVRSLVLRMM